MNYIEQANKIIQAKNKQGKYSLFSTDVFKRLVDSEQVEIYYDILKEWDDNCNLPIEFGEFLNTISCDKRNTVAFSRVYIGGLDNPSGNIVTEEINIIANNGLINNGHVNSSGANQRIKPPYEALTPLVGLGGWINLVGSYKKNNAVVFYSFPSELVNEDCDFKSREAVKYIYNFDGELTYIKPEYLIGMTIKNKNAIDMVLTKDEMIELNNNKTK